MQHVHAGVDQWPQPVLHLGRRQRQAGLKILLLPLRQPDRDREIRRGGAPHRSDRFDRKTAALNQRRAAPAVAALVAAGPEKLVDQVAVRAVQFDAVETQAHRLRASGSEGFDGLRHCRLGHRHPRFAPWFAQARRALQRCWRTPGRACAAQCADMPELGPDPSADRLHGPDHLRPARKRLGAVEVRHRWVVAGRRPVDQRGLGDDQPAVLRGPTCVIGRGLGAKHAFGRERSRHRRHHQAVGQLK